MTSAWYETAEWTVKAREEFEQRLRRSRPHSRPQYLRIKALSLLSARLTVEADGLLGRLVDEYPDALDARFALEVRGDIAATAGRANDAVDLYRAAIASHPHLPALSGTSGQVHTKLAEVLFSLGDRASADEVALHLRLGMDHLNFNADVYRWCVLNTRVALQAGDRDNAVASAESALTAATAGPQFRRHPDVGLVDPDDKTIAWLRDVCRS